MSQTTTTTTTASIITGNASILNYYSATLYGHNNVTDTLRGFAWSNFSTYPNGYTHNVMIDGGLIGDYSIVITHGGPKIILYYRAILCSSYPGNVHSYGLEQTFYTGS